MKRLKITGRIIYNFILWIAICSCLFNQDPVNKKTKTKNNDQNLKNNHSTFVYNMIPDDPAAKISIAYSKAVNAFAVKLLDKVYNSKQFMDNNVILSPFSIGRNLAVITEGTAGESKQEILNCLGGQAALDDAQAALSELLYADNSVVFQCADSLWLDSQKYSLKQNFRQLINKKYGVEIQEVDFSDKMKTAKTINSWINLNTGSKIQDVVSAQDLDPLTVLFLINAVYFEADWTSPFDVTLTKKSDFQTPDNVVSVDMMSSTYLYQTFKTEIYEKAKIYYGKTGADFFYLDVYMPISVSMEDFVRNHCLDAIAHQGEENYGNIKIPKFFFETRMELIPFLKELGMNGIFNPGMGDITGMINEKIPLYVSEVKHIAGIKTDEEGTKAYAVTETEVTKSSMLPSSNPDVIFNRPFAYFIRAGKNGLVLFAGIANNPNQR